MKHKILGLFALALSVLANGQESMSLEKAFQLALEHNHQIGISKNSVKISEVGASVFSNNQLPTLTGSSNGNLSQQVNSFELNSGENQTTDPVQTISYGANLNLSYTLFDGGVRYFNVKQAQAELQRSELDLREVIESTFLQISNLYLDLQVISKEISILEQNLTISRQRLERARKQHEYGQSTQLNLLNAELDFQNDSIEILNLSLSKDQLVRSLNLLIGKPVSSNLALTDSLELPGPIPSLDQVWEQTKTNNSQILQMAKSLEVSERALQASKASRLPKVNLQGAYSYSRTEYGFNPNLRFLSTLGPSVGLGLTWNIFDGGRTKTSVEINRLNLQTNLLQKEQIQYQLEQEVRNAYQSLENAMVLLEVREKGLEIARRNFNRTQEAYKQGQVNSLEFRQAQINLFNAETGRIEVVAQINKLNFQLKQLRGELLN